MPDEYLPPNKILFLQSLPVDVTQEALVQLFSQFVSLSLLCVAVKRFAERAFGYRYPNLVEVRMIPTKKDIAFVEYADETSSGVAKDALHNYKLDGEHKIKVILLLSLLLLSPRAQIVPRCLDYIRKKVVRHLIALYISGIPQDSRCRSCVWFFCNVPSSV